MRKKKENISNQGQKWEDNFLAVALKLVKKEYEKSYKSLNKLILSN